MQLDCGICTIRNWQVDDVPRLSQIADNRNVSRYMTARFPSPYTIDDARDWIERNIGETATNFAIEFAGEVAGGAGYELGLHERSHSAEIGYWLGEAYWGRGIASAALSALTGYAFKRHGLRRIFATIYAPNAASVRVAEKCGYVREAVMQGAIAKDGQMFDAFLYARVR